MTRPWPVSDPVNRDPWWMRVLAFLSRGIRQ